MPKALPLRFAHTAMRTQFELALFVDDATNEGDAKCARATALAEEIWREIDAVEARLSPFRSDSDLTHLARNPGRQVRLHPVALAFLAQAEQLVHETTGAFDPTVGPLAACLRGDNPPTPAMLAAARETIGFTRQVHIDDVAGTAQLVTPDAHLDPGALGKGFALDRALFILQDCGVARALLHAGTSSALALGRFPIAIADPDGGPATLATLDEAALSVSAAHGRIFRWPDGKGSHIIDPRSGGPARGARLCAVVIPIDPQCRTGDRMDTVPCAATVAEAWSTALMVLGPDGLPVLQAQRPGASVHLVDETGTVHSTGPAFDRSR